MSRLERGVRTFDVPERLDRGEIAALAATKGDQTISVCIPCRDEAATIGPLVSVVRRELVESTGLVDELIVLDDRSTDDTARVARDAGARVVDIDEVHATHGTGARQGQCVVGDPAGQRG